MNNKCGCCEGVELLTPATIANRPGLPALAYRVGTHVSLLESMKARLTGLCIDPDGSIAPGQRERPLDRLTTRTSSDPSIALLDGWAILGDALTFYQERIANEGYLRTAIERRSVLELARLVGYQPRPGVASSAYLAFKLETGTGEIIIPRGTGAKSIPGKDELPQTFETSEDISARPEWNKIRPRLSRPQKVTSDSQRIYLAGTSTNLKPNDLLLIDGNIGDKRTFTRLVESIEVDFENQRTNVYLQADPFSIVVFRGQVQREVSLYESTMKLGPIDLQAASSVTNILAPLKKALKEKLTTIEKLDSAVHLALHGVHPSENEGPTVDGLLDVKNVVDKSASSLQKLDSSLETLAAQVSKKRLELLKHIASIAGRSGDDAVRQDLGPKRQLEILSQALRIVNLLSADLAEAKTMPTLKGAVLRVIGGEGQTGTLPLLAESASANLQNTIREVIGKFRDIHSNAPPSGDDNVKDKFRDEIRAASSDLAPGDYKDSLDRLLQVIESADSLDTLRKSVKVAIENGLDLEGGSKTESLIKLSDMAGASATGLEIQSLINVLQVLASSDLEVDVLRKSIRTNCSLRSPTMLAEVAAVESIRAMNEMDLSDLVDSLERVQAIADVFRFYAGNKGVAAELKPLFKHVEDILVEANSDSQGTLANLIKSTVLENPPNEVEPQLKALVSESQQTLNELLPGSPWTISELVSRLASALEDITGKVTRFRHSFDIFNTAFDRLIIGLKAIITRVRAIYAGEIRGIARRYQYLANFTGPAELFAKKAYAILMRLRDDIPADEKLFEVALAGAVSKVRATISDLQGVASESGDFGALIVRLRSLIRELDELISRVAVESEGAPLPPTDDPTVALDQILNVLRGPLMRRQASQPSGRADLLRNLSDVFNLESDSLPQLLQAFEPALRAELYQAWRNAKVQLPLPKVFALRARTSLFGYNAPKEMEYEQPDEKKIDPRKLRELTEAERLKVLLEFDADKLKKPSSATEWEPALDEDSNKLFLDNEYDGVVAVGYVAIQTPNRSNPLVFEVAEVTLRPRTAYGISGKSTDITIEEDENGAGWWNPRTSGPGTPSDGFEFIRKTTVYAKSELLLLAEEPIETPIGSLETDSSTSPIQQNSTLPASLPDEESPDQIELDGLYDGLEAGRTLFVSGERNDLPGVTSTERVVLAGIRQILHPDLPGDTPHTRLSFASDLAFSYRRNTVTIQGNVVGATHGETRNEVLGSGNATLEFQQFSLSSPSLTYLAAPTAAGASSTLSVSVNDIEWYEAEGFPDRKATDRSFVTEIGDQQLTTILFGDGRFGARLPTGSENVTATYRVGIGNGGNVEAKQISQLAAQILGVKEVVNPMPASGGADPDSRDQIKRNAPLPVMALDRLLSVQDYADFARTFAGIGKAAASRLSDGRREWVQVTVAGAGDIPIDKDSELFRNLRRALLECGDPQQDLRLDVRELVLLIIDASVKVLPGYQWESIEKNVRQALLKALSFERRELAQDVTQSEIIATIQQAPGVSFVDLNVLHSVAESTSPQELIGLAGALESGGAQPTGRIVVQPAGSKIHVVQNVNESLATIAALYQPRASLEEIRRLNPQVDSGESLKLGTKIEVSRIWPAQIAYLSPDVPDTLILSEVH